jgi:hypothetical protein
MPGLGFASVSQFFDLLPTAFHSVKTVIVLAPEARSYAIRPALANKAVKGL